jgi:hypothetical protein
MTWEWARGRRAGRLGPGAFSLPFIVPPNYVVSANNILYYRRHVPPTPCHGGAGQGGRYPGPLSAGPLRWVVPLPLPLRLARRFPGLVGLRLPTDTQRVSTARALPLPLLRLTP